MNAYFEKLKTETNWLKLFIPLFILFSILLVVIAPVIIYVIEVVIKHNEYGGGKPLYALIVALIFSAVLAGVIRYRHIVENQK